MRAGDRALVLESVGGKMANEIRMKIEFRADGSRQSPGQLVGTLLTYGERASDRPEVFLDGALSWPENGIVINEQHNRAAPILRAVPVVEGRAVKIKQKFPNTQRGRDAATNVRIGLFTGLSIEFRAQAETYVGTERRISKAKLFAASLVDSPSYKGSQVDVRERSTGSRSMRWKPYW